MIIKIRRNFINLVFGPGQEIPPVTKLWKLRWSQYIIFNYSNNFPPLGTKESEQQKRTITERLVGCHTSMSVTAQTCKHRTAFASLFSFSSKINETAICKCISPNTFYFYELAKIWKFTETHHFHFQILAGEVCKVEDFSRDVSGPLTNLFYGM